MEALGKWETLLITLEAPLNEQVSNLVGDSGSNLLNIAVKFHPTTRAVLNVI